MKFVLRMAWREVRAAWLRLLFFFLCVALGVAAIVVLRSVVQNVRTTLVREARALLGADLVVQSVHPLAGDAKAALESQLSIPEVHERMEVIETQTMAGKIDQSGISNVRLVEIRAVEPRYPFYGTMELESGQPFSHALLEHHGVLVQQELLSELAVKVGDQIQLAGQPFTIRGVITRDRVQRTGGFAFGPRVYADVADLRQTSLLSFGSRATYLTLVRVDDAMVNRLVQRLRRAFRKEVVTVRSWRTVEDRLGRNLTLAENYLSLVGFAMVVLGGIGVWSVTRVFVQQKIKTIAILKCVGASSSRVLATYVVQVLVLALGGSVLGVGIAAAAIRAIPESALKAVAIETANITTSAALQGLAVGVLVSLLFALVPLLEVRRVKPLLLLRADTATTARKRDWQSALAGIVTLSALVLIAVWQADSLKAGLYVSIGLAAIALALAGVGRLLVRAVAPLTKSRRFALRHAVVSLRRSGNQTRVILMAVGVGCFFILAVRALQSNLIDEFTIQVGSHAPDLILIDVQDDQAAGVRQITTPYLRAEPRMFPLMRARVVAVEGARAHLPNADAVRRDGTLTREFGITYRDRLQTNEKVTGGQFWNGAMQDPKTADGFDTEVSIEQMVHDESHVELGDAMTFDIGGQRVRARVSSIRKVSWDEAENGGFVFVFREGPATARMAHTFIAFLETRDDATARGSLQRDLVRAYPNVSAIDVNEVLSSLRDIVRNVTLAVTIVGAVTLFSGALILVGAIAMTKFQRVYEAAIYRTLGASTRVLMTMVTLEYGLLGLLAGLIGAGGAAALSWAAARKLFEIEWHPTVGLLAIGVAAATVVVGVVGLVASADVVVRKPLATLRSE